MKLTRKQQILAASAAVALLAAGAGAGWVILQKRRVPLTPEQLVEIGTRQHEQRHYLDAFRTLSFAADQAPENAEFQWKAAQAAIALAQRSQALPYVRTAWARGLKTKDVLMALVDCSPPPASADERLKTWMDWLHELPPDGAREEIEGDLHFRATKVLEGLERWEARYAAAPSAELANKIAMAHLMTQHPEKAVGLLQGLRKGPYLNEEGYGVLATQLAAQDQAAAAEQVFTEGRTAFPEGDRLMLRQATFLAAKDRPADARSLLEKIKGRAADIEAERLHHHARILLGFLIAVPGGDAALNELAALPEGDAPWLEGERLYYRALKTILAGKDKAALEDLKRVRTLLPSLAPIEWTAARALARTEAWPAAADAYRRMTGLLGYSPMAQLEFAQVLYRSGKPEEALAALSRLHSRKLVSKDSVELFRNIALQRGLAREANEAQKLLERKYGDDPEVRIAGAALALQSGKLEEAAATLNALIGQFPEREDVEVGRLTVLLAKKDYEGVLREAAASRQPPKSVLPFQVAALQKLGRGAEAEDLFDRRLAETPDPGLMLSFANYLLSERKAEKAARWYGEVLKQQPAHPIAHLGLAAIAAERRDWKEVREQARAAAATDSPSPLPFILLTEADLEEKRFESAVEQSRRALEKSPDHPRALLFQGMAFLELQRFEEAESALQRCATALPDAAPVLWQFARVKMNRGQDAQALELLGRLSAKPGAQDDPAIQGMRMVLLARTKKFDEARAVLARIKPRMQGSAALLSDAWLLETEGKLAEAADALKGSLSDPEVACAWGMLMIRLSRAETLFDILGALRVDATQWTRLADVARETKQSSIEAACLLRATRLDPENGSLLSRFAETSASLERFDEEAALAAARKAVALQPESIPALESCSAVLLKASKHAECVTLLERVEALTNRSARLLYALSQAYEQSGNVDKAAQKMAACMTHPQTAGVEAGNLARPALKRKLEELRAKLDKPDGKRRD